MWWTMPGMTREGDRDLCRREHRCSVISPIHATSFASPPVSGGTHVIRLWRVDISRAGPGHDLQISDQNYGCATPRGIQVQEGHAIASVGGNSRQLNRGYSHTCLNQSRKDGFYEEVVIWPYPALSEENGLIFRDAVAGLITDGASQPLPSYRMDNFLATLSISIYRNPEQPTNTFDSTRDFSPSLGDVFPQRQIDMDQGPNIPGQVLRHMGAYATATFIMSAKYFRLTVPVRDGYVASKCLPGRAFQRGTTRPTGSQRSLSERLQALSPTVLLHDSPLALHCLLQWVRTCWLYLLLVSAWCVVFGDDWAYRRACRSREIPAIRPSPSGRQAYGENFLWILRRALWGWTFWFPTVRRLGLMLPMESSGPYKHMKRRPVLVRWLTTINPEDQALPVRMDPLASHDNIVVQYVCGMDRVFWSDTDVCNRRIQSPDDVMPLVYGAEMIGFIQSMQLMEVDCRATAPSGIGYKSIDVPELRAVYRGVVEKLLRAC
ncbi:hypothetical protein IW262DRAFT_1297849 [Armillaria fumosa]|nr:hypothetical protein IW262DRAFT_1297849 [Armillaria fumosa]